MHYTGVAAAALSLFAFQILMRRIPETLDTIWNRKLIANSSSPTLLEEQYRMFVLDVARLLNHPGQWAMGALLAVCGFARFPYTLWVDTGGLKTKTLLSEILLRGTWDFRIVVAESLLGLILGLVAWRMVITGWKVWRLGKKFDLIPQLEHPDRCGGLEPLGTLCLWNALLVAIPGTYLGYWIIMAPGIEEYGYRYVALHSAMLPVPMALAALSFFLPLWSVHQEMVAHRRAEIEPRLNDLSQSINHLARQMLDRADDMEPQDFEKTATELARMRQSYQQYQRIPVWPFNRAILMKFITSQATQILSLTGLGDTVVGILADLLERPQT
jgi:hypothetical protein